VKKYIQSAKGRVKIEYFSVSILIGFASCTHIRKIEIGFNVSFYAIT
jgi:hypothetical protein